MGGPYLVSLEVAGEPALGVRLALEAVQTGDTLVSEQVAVGRRASGAVPVRQALHTLTLLTQAAEGICTAFHS